MKKIFLSFTFLVLISLIGLISILSTIGIETKNLMTSSQKILTRVIII